MNTEIYYFSGTGNSLRTAQELQKRIPESKLMPVVRLLAGDVIKTRAERVGFVFPNFCLTVPIPLFYFLKKADLTSAGYIFAVSTRGGSPSRAADHINAILKKQGKRLNAELNVNMPWNLPLGKENLPASFTEEGLKHLESQMLDKLGEFSVSVRNKEDHLKPDTDVTYHLPSWGKVFDIFMPRRLNYRLHKNMYQEMIDFYSDSDCNSCGTCSKVCLSGKIVMNNGKPAWQKDVDCYACFACINYCPQRSIQIRARFPIESYTHVNDRYHHPRVTYKDIADQK